MPLIQSPSEEARKENTATEIAAGKPPKQAVAIGYSVQRANDDDTSMGPSVVLSEFERINKLWRNP